MTARKSRFSLGDLMIFIAFAAIILAPNLSEPLRRVQYLPHAVLNCVMVAILVANRRLSPWMWVVLAAQASNSLFALAKQVVRYDLLVPMSFLLEGWLGSLLYVLGLGMTFRDVRRRLSALEDRADAAPDDGRPA